MVDVIPPADLELGPFGPSNGDPGRWVDPRYADNAQALLIAGRPWRGPPLAHSLVPGNGTSTTTLWIPTILHPGAKGWAWGFFGIIFDQRLDAAGAWVNPPSITARAYQPDLSTELSTYTSKVADGALPWHDQTINASSLTLAAAKFYGSWSWSGDQSYLVPPVFDSPGILEVPPSTQAQEVVLKLEVVNLILVELQARPVFSQAQISTW